MVVAVAGGSGGFGRTLVEAIKERGTNDVVVLTRKPNPTLEAARGVRFIPIDYSDIFTATKVLEDNNIHTVIAAVSYVPSSGMNYEDRLIKAAEASSVTKRFIPSNWGSRLLDNDPRPGAEQKKLLLQTLDEAESLEYTSVLNGYFLDYWGMPKVPSYMSPFTMVVDIPSNTAVIPGTGDERISLTHTRDVARYVAALLDLEKWDKETVLVGETTTWNQFLKCAQEVKGTTFNVTYDGPELYLNGKATELPCHVAMYSFFPKEMCQALAASMNMMFAEERLYVGSNTRNKLFDKIKPWSVRDILEMAYKD